MTYLDEVDITTAEFGELYDELPLWSAPFGLMMLERIPMKPGMTVVDVGAGTGFLTVELAQRCGPDTTIVAVDPSRPLMARLHRKLDYLGIRNARLVTSDASELDLPEGTVDLVVSNLGVNNFSNADAVLRTCFRVTRPGGTIALTSNLVGHMHEFYEAYRETLTELGQNDAIPALETHVAHRATLESVREMLGRAGHEEISVATDSFQMRFADGSSMLRHHFIRLGFLPSWASIISRDAIERTFDALAKKLDAIASKNGELSLTIPMAYFEAHKPMAP